MKTWKKPTFALLQNSKINSANQQTMAIYENVSYTLQNTCTFEGADCTTYDGYTGVVSFPSGIAPDATMYGPITLPPGGIGTFAAGTISTCTPGLQCS